MLLAIVNSDIPMIYVLRVRQWQAMAVRPNAINRELLGAQAASA
jgi:hypothetical protein